MLDFYDQDGMRRWRTMPKGATKDDANEELGKLVTKVRRRVYRSAKDIPKFEAVAEAWLAYKNPPGFL